MKHRAIIIALVAVFVGGAACSNKHKRGTAISSEVIRASNREAQQVFDEGVAALHASQWAVAMEKFRWVQAEYPKDAIAPVAELYAARAALGDLSAADTPPRATTLASLASLAESREDDRVRWAAAVYYAIGLVVAGEDAEAVAVLRDYPSSQLSPLVLPVDHLAGALLVAEGQLGAARYSDAIASYGRLWTLAAVDADAEEILFATSRALESATRIKEAELVDLSSSDDAFARAVAGLTLLERRAAKASPEEAEALQALQQRIATDVATIGEASRLEAVSYHLAANQPAQRLAIALALPLSGPAAPAGRAALDGALVAAQAFKPGMSTTTVIFVDAQTQEAAPQLARLRQLGVAAVIGPLDPKLAATWAAAANAEEIPLIALTTEPIGEHAGDWAFRWFIDAGAEARAAAQVAVQEQGDLRIAVLRPNIGYGRQMGSWFADAARAAGGEIVLDREYDRNATNFSALASEVAAAKPHAIFIPDTGAKVAEVTAFLAQANVWGIAGDRRPDPRSKRTEVHYIGTSLWNDPALLRQARSYVTGALLPAWSSSAFEDTASRAFFADFNRATGRDASDLAAFAADAVGFVRSRFVLGQSSALQVRDAALQKELYRGITGGTRFRSNGEPTRILRFITVREGNFVPTDRTATVGLDES